jgi:hypothetical protein
MKVLDLDDLDDLGKCCPCRFAAVEHLSVTELQQLQVWHVGLQWWLEDETIYVHIVFIGLCGDYWENNYQYLYKVGRVAICDS